MAHKHSPAAAPPSPQARNQAEMLVQLTRGELEVLVREAVIEAVAAVQDGGTAPALLDRQQLARALGVSERTLRRMRDLGLPTLWLIDSPRFELAAVLEWVRSNSAHLHANVQSPVAERGDERSQVAENKDDSPSASKLVRLDANGGQR